MGSNTPNSWLLAECWATSSTLEAAQDAFLHAGCLGLEVDDGIGPEGQRKYADDRVLIKAYFYEGTNEAEIAAVVSGFFAPLAPISFSHMQAQDWQRNFVLSCTTFKVEPNIFIVPTFEAEDFKQKQAGQLFIEMDPENAFGTGQHQTTKLCLTAIYNHLSSLPEAARAKLSAADIGCGSGILAILMKKLQVGRVLASENDDSALTTAIRNASRNGVAFEPLLVDDEYIYPSHTFDLIVANILAPVLIEMAKNIISATKVNGTIILSGILCNQSQQVISAYEDCGAIFIQQTTMDDWCALKFARK